MNVLDYIKNNLTLLDGGTGTLLQAQGLMPGEAPAEWNITHPQAVINAHKAYFDAGSNIVCTNTFSANLLKYGEKELTDIITAAFANARSAKAESVGGQAKFIAFDIGPLGRLLKPCGELGFEEAVNIFAFNVRLAESLGADLIFIETVTDIAEARAALIAAKENSRLPVFVSCAYGEDGRLLTGASPREAALILEGLGADAIGVNCSFGPDKLLPVAQEYIKYASVPVIFKPNAGMPKENSGKTVYDILPRDFADYIKEAAQKGVRLFGGCCGTTPEHIRLAAEKTKNLSPLPVDPASFSAVCSAVKTVEIGKKPLIIGERINPTGRKLFRKAIEEKNARLILSEAVLQEENGANILDVNAGAPGTDESESFGWLIPELQSVCALPLQIDTSDPKALETALRLYNGRALINSVNGKKESMAAVFPLVKKYGGTVIALTLDENGIPPTVEGRLKIAENVLKTAGEYGINKNDIIFDALVMAVSADNNAAAVTLGTVRAIKEKLGCKTVLGISNVSFGLPDRDTLNSVFLSCAFANGLDAAIANPLSEKIMSVYRAYSALSGFDEGFAEYISSARSGENATAEKQDEKLTLKGAVIKGFKDKAAEITRELVKNRSASDIAENELIPALDEVGRGYETNRIFLPGLLMSAEAAKSAFAEIKKANTVKNAGNGFRVILATVEGDIHDIGKNIVRLLLENYGFDVTDLGMNVPPQAIADCAAELNAPIVGLSALMTTTLPAMEKTVRLLNDTCPWVKTIVGGAVLTPEYAKKINADFYAKDATETVEISRKICAESQQKSGERL